ncbi:flagellar basal-body rod protein FlgG [Tepidicaulis sp. LMO-SS28]|uniref:flagellar basal-body rod protein FlgG n=1 Tax=Tepidicaulis sp. LMO-SS28 TaxID=3447455 RepID=UPI003EE25589
MRALGIAATGMMAQQTNVEVISNNIANMNTTAFQRARAEFTDLFYMNERRQGMQSTDEGNIVPAGIQIGLGVKTAAVRRVSVQGNLANTGNQYDLALQGRGYFMVDLPQGQVGYTRDGAFQKSPDGQLVTADGYVVQPGIAIPDNAKDVVVNQSGEVLAYVDGEAEPVNLGQIEISTFANEAGLVSIGDNMLQETAASGPPIAGVPGDPGFGSIRQKFLESSNVNSVQEITDLISAQRAYEMNSKVVETADQMFSTVTRMR